MFLIHRQWYKVGINKLVHVCAIWSWDQFIVWFLLVVDSRQYPQHIWMGWVGFGTQSTNPWSVYGIVMNSRTSESVWLCMSLFRDTQSWLTQLNLPSTIRSFLCIWTLAFSPDLLRCIIICAYSTWMTILLASNFCRPLLCKLYCIFFWQFTWLGCLLLYEGPS
jgi:hypothetical protein